MCGIVGWISFAADLRLCKQQFSAMVATMRLRGPDDGGAWFAPNAAIGHRRLAIIDLTGGAQPRVCGEVDAQTVLSFSGEIYNFTELREELRHLGHTFTTRCDTEVILRGYTQWGAGVAARLNGMFAFAIWDARRELLLLVPRSRATGWVAINVSLWKVVSLKQKGLLKGLC